jgi:hypothetical protein
MAGFGRGAATMAGLFFASCVEEGFGRTMKVAEEVAAAMADFAGAATSQLMA